MRARLVTRKDAAPQRLVGAVLSRELRGENGMTMFPKGAILAAEDVERLIALPWEELHLVEMQPGDLHEDEAGARMAAASAGAGVIVRRHGGGHWPLAAATRGILDVARQELREVNAMDGMCVYTLYDGQVVEEGEIVARAKIIPFVIEQAVVEAAEVVARHARGLVRVRPFIPMRVGAVVQESLGERAMARFRGAFGEKVAWFGSTLLEPAFVAPSAAAIAEAITAADEQRADVIVVAGTKAMDVLDPAFAALARLGARMERHGVPAHPGSLFWTARLGRVPVLGMPSCGLFSQATVFDLVLPRILAGEDVGRAELADLGHGGFLTRDMAFRFPPYRPSTGRGEVA